jgi:hypothetical protein
MMALNALIAGPLLALLLMLFGVQHIRLPLPMLDRLVANESAGAIVWTMVPGAGIGFGCLWYWLVLVGRSRGISWGGACIYGVGIALADVLIWGLIGGTVHGAPLLGLLIGLVMLLMLPSLTLAMCVFGLIMGVLNGRAAQRWIERRRGA